MNIESTESSSNVVTVKLRISPELRDLIAKSAKTHNRSMNADMALRLEQSFKKEVSSIDLLKNINPDEEPLLALDLSLLILKFLESKKKAP